MFATTSALHWQWHFDVLHGLDHFSDAGACRTTSAHDPSRVAQHPTMSPVARSPADCGGRGPTLQTVADPLAEEMRLHMAEPLPDSVEKGWTTEIWTTEMWMPP